MREKIGKAGDKVIEKAGYLYYRAISILPLIFGLITGSYFLDALKTFDILGMIIMGALAAGSFALVWYLWSPRRHLRELD